MMTFRPKKTSHVISCIVLFVSFYLGRADDHEPRLRSGDHRELQLPVVPSTCDGTFQIVKAGFPSTTPLSEVLIGTYASGSTIDIGACNSVPLSMVILCQGPVLSYLNLKYGTKSSRNEYVVPFSIKLNDKNKYTAEADLNVVGAKNVRVKGYTSSSTPAVEMNIVFNIIKTLPPPPITSLYTNFADFGLGSGVNVNYDTDQVQLNSASALFEFIWVAKWGTGTVVKIDTNTGDILGEYKSSPTSHGYGRPASVTVDHDGSVWLVNSLSIYDGYGSVVHIGLKENNQCEDRNGNGMIDTSTELGDIKPWTFANVSTADDECIIHYVKSHSTDLRHVSVNDDNDVWVSGSYGIKFFDLIKGGGPAVPFAGTIIRSEPSVGYGGWVGQMSGEILWSAFPLLRWNTSLPLTGLNGNPSGANIGPNIGPPADGTSWSGLDGIVSYGLCIDKEGNVWETGLFGNNVWKFSKDGTFIGRYNHGFYHAQGCVVDARVGGTNDVWITHSYASDKCAVDHLKNDGTIVGTVYLGCPVGAGGTSGVAVDAKGKIWATNTYNHSVARIDPTLGVAGEVDLVVPLGAGANPFFQGDMTGSTLRAAPTTGNWMVTIDRSVATFDWSSTTISWHDNVPLMTTLMVTVASSVDGMLYSAATSVVNGSKLTIGIPVGRYLQVKVAVQRGNRSTPSPILYDLKVESTFVGTCGSII